MSRALALTTRYLFKIKSNTNCFIRSNQGLLRSDNCGLTTSDFWPLPSLWFNLVLHSQTSTPLCQHWRKVWLYEIFILVKEKNALACLYFFKPLIIVLGSTRHRIWQQCLYKIMLRGTCFEHREASPGIKTAKSPCKRQELLLACLGLYCLYCNQFRMKVTCHFQRAGC